MSEAYVACVNFNLDEIKKTVNQTNINNIFEKNGITPLMTVIMDTKLETTDDHRKRYECVVYLVENCKADISITNKQEFNAFHFAAVALVEDVFDDKVIDKWPNM